MGCVRVCFLLQKCVCVFSCFCLSIPLCTFFVLWSPEPEGPAASLNKAVSQCLYLAILQYVHTCNM